MWRIRRIEPAPEGGVSIDCELPTRPVQVTLENTATGQVAVVQACNDPNDDPCRLLGELDTTYTPNDWAEECTS